MITYLIFGKRATDALWQDENDIDAVVEAIDDMEAEFFVFDPSATPVHDVLEAYSKWNDYAYLTPEQYERMVELV